MYELENSISLNSGVPGRDWRFLPEDTELTDIYGRPAVWEQIADYGETQNRHWAQVGPFFAGRELRNSQVTTMESNPLGFYLENITSDGYGGTGPEQTFDPNTFFDPAVADELSILQTEITSAPSSGAVRERSVGCGPPHRCCKAMAHSRTAPRRLTQPGGRAHTQR
jgi:putative aldouronate transport system substrate-binding protein